MRVPLRLTLAALLALVALLAVVAVAIGLREGGVEHAGFAIAGGTTDVRGTAFLEQDGDRLTGFVVVWGLEPRSAHAVHFHGPGSSCGTKADPVAVHPDLEADASGVAYIDVDVTVDRQLLDGGFYYNVHEGPSRQADNPEIACGDIAPVSSTASSG